MIAKCNLYLTADRLSVVTEGDRRAAFLLVGSGGEVTKEMQSKYGIVDPELRPSVATVSEEKIETRKTRVPRALRTQ